MLRCALLRFLHYALLRFALLCYALLCFSLLCLLLDALFSTGCSTLFAGSLTSPREGRKNARMAMHGRARLRVTPVPAERLRRRHEWVEPAEQVRMWNILQVVQRCSVHCFQQVIQHCLLARWRRHARASRMLAWQWTFAHACVSHLCQLNGYGADANEWKLPNKFICGTYKYVCIYIYIYIYDQFLWSI